jgi:hypothetical protein
MICKLNIILVIAFVHIQSVFLAQNISINEVSTTNMSNYLDANGKPKNWVELYNNNPNPILLSDYFLSDNEDNLTKYALPNVVLNGNDFILIFLDGKDMLDGNEIHTNFRINKNGGALLLSNQSGNIIDLVEIPKLPLDVSYGRSIDGSGTWGYFESPTPLQPNIWATFYTCLMQNPQIELPSGSYSGIQQTIVENPNSQGTIHYTLNGSEPNENSPIYGSVINIDTWNYPNNLSTIPTNPSFNYPINAYSETRAHTRGWLPPFADVNNISVLKVKCFANGCVPSETASASYIINQSHDLPVISLVTDSLNFFDEEIGIYLYGSDTIPNYDLEGFISERNVVLTYFDEAGNVVFSENLGLRIAGGGSRHSAVKNLKLYWRDQYGKRKLEEKIFSEIDLQVFETMLLRSGGHRPDCLPKDELGSDITRVLPFEKSTYNYVQVYLNGEYWGIHSFKQKLDEDHLHNKYKIPKKELVLLFGKNRVNYGIAQDGIDYQNMVDFAFGNDMNVTENYNRLDSLMDIENYRDYMISQIFLGNGDWPYSNIKFWRKRTDINTQSSLGHDGKYRWILYDLDGTFGGSCSDVFVTFNTLSRALTPNPPFTEYTKLFRGLMTSEQFQRDFINRTCDLLNSSFLPKVTRPKREQIKTFLDDQVLDHVVRWRYPSIADSLHHRANEIPNLVKWDYLHGRMDTFLIERPRYFRNHMSNMWSLSDTSKIELDVNDPIMGKVKINSIIIDENLEGVTTNIYPWEGTYFQDIEIPLKAIANPGYQFVRWDGINFTDDEIVVTIQGDTNFTAIFEIDTTYIEPLPLFINELQPANGNFITDEFGEFDDWLELYNPNNFPVQLNQYALTDDKNNPTKYKIDIPLEIPAKGFALFWCDDQTGQGIYHTTFKIKNAPNEFIGLYNLKKNQFEDSIKHPNVAKNKSYGRSSDGHQDWIVFNIPTPNATNEWIDEEEAPNDRLFLYPNPNSTSVLFASQEISGTIFSMSGRIVGSIHQTQIIPINHLSSGIYIIKTDKNKVMKFVVIGE